jgi:hypothetical protein
MHGIPVLDAGHVGEPCAADKHPRGIVWVIDRQSDLPFAGAFIRGIVIDYLAGQLAFDAIDD